MRAACLLCVALWTCCAAVAARAETPEDWIALGARVHGAFGSFLPVGIRIGLDALQRADTWMPKLIDMNKTLDPMGRYNAVMNAADLFTVETLPVAPK